MYWFHDVMPSDITNGWSLPPTDHALFCVGGFPQVPVVDDSLSSCYKHNTISHVLFICTINCSYWINTSITIYVMFCYYSKMFEVLIEKIHFYYFILFDKYYTTKILPIWCKTLNNQSINIWFIGYILFSVALKNLWRLSTAVEGLPNGDPRPWAGKGRYRVTPAVTRGLGFCGRIWRITSVSSTTSNGDRGPKLTLISRGLKT